MVFTHLALSLQVTLVAHQQEDDAVGLYVAAGLLQPVVDILEGAAVGDVEQEEPAHGVAVVGPGDGSAGRRRRRRKEKEGEGCVKSLFRNDTCCQL